jgi:hypothetical protein
MSINKQIRITKTTSVFFHLTLINIQILIWASSWYKFIKESPKLTSDQSLAFGIALVFLGSFLNLAIIFLHSYWSDLLKSEK